jgi:hypothetical protein
MPGIDDEDRPMGAEQERVAGFGRLELGLRQASDWYLWGPYLSGRQWGTVREDYSADGEAWGGPWPVPVSGRDRGVRQRLVAREDLCRR